MGKRVAALIERDERTVLASNADESDAVIDFTSAEGVQDAVAVARKAACPLVVGTTGLCAQIHRQLDDLSVCVPVLIAPNTALGSTVQARLVERAAQLLPGSWVVSIEEHHHAEKRDAPSGTARRLMQRLEDAGRPVNPAAVESIRDGETVGVHIVKFSDSAESIEIVHRAESRDVFARGAIDAALWLIGRTPGHYTIEDVIGF